MPRYFFHIKGPEGDDIIDKVGIELPDLESAKSKARELARALLGLHERPEHKEPKWLN